MPDCVTAKRQRDTLLFLCVWVGGCGCASVCVQCGGGVRVCVCLPQSFTLSFPGWSWLLTIFGWQERARGYTSTLSTTGTHVTTHTHHSHSLLTQSPLTHSPLTHSPQTALTHTYTGFYTKGGPRDIPP